MPVVDGCCPLGAGHSCCAAQPRPPISRGLLVQSTAKGRERSSCAGTGVLGTGLVLIRAVVERLEDSGCCPGWYDEDKHVAAMLKSGGALCS